MLQHEVRSYDTAASGTKTPTKENVFVTCAKLESFVFFYFKDCMHVASEEGDYAFKKVLHRNQRVNKQIDTTVCGLYILTDPDKIVEISIKYLDVNCNAGGLMAVISHTHSHNHHT